MVLGKLQNAFLVNSKVLFPLLEKLNIDAPDLCRLPCVERRIIGNPGDARSDCIIQHSNSVGCEEEDASVELQNS